MQNLPEMCWAQRLRTWAALMAPRGKPVFQGDFFFFFLNHSKSFFVRSQASGHSNPTHCIITAGSNGGTDKRRWIYFNGVIKISPEQEYAQVK